MLNKKQAITLRKALVTANAGSTRILSAIIASKKGKLTASAHKKYSAELKQIKIIAAKAEKHLINSFKSKADLIKSAKIDAVEKLLSASAELSMRAKIMSKVLADADELNELPDGDAGFEADECETIECDELGEEIVESDDEEILDADDELGEEIVESDDEEIVTDPVSARRRAMKRANARRVSTRRRSISAGAKKARVASVKRNPLVRASKSLINWDFKSRK